MARRRRKGSPEFMYWLVITALVLALVQEVSK